MFAALVLAAITDLRSQRIPNWLSLPLAAVGLVVHSFAVGGEGIAFAAAGLAAGFALLIPFYALGGMGAGDVKLLAAVGAWVGAKQVGIVFLATAALGGVYALGLWLVPAVATSGVRSTCKSVATGARSLVLTGDVRSVLPDGTQAGAPKLCYAVCIGAATFLTQTAIGIAVLRGLGFGI